MNTPLPARAIVIGGLLTIVLATVVAYLPATSAGFIWDDEKWVTENPLISDADGLRRIWFSQDHPSQYFPMVYTTFRMEHALWGLDARGYHITNILLHALNALLVWLLLTRLKVPGAWIAAAIFALHPVHVESVAWIAERKNVLMFLFFSLSLLAWLAFVRSSDRKSADWRFYGLSLLLYFVSLLSKTTACTMPAALVVMLWLEGRPVDRKRWLQITPYVVLGLAAGLFTMWWERHQQGVYSAQLDIGLLDRPLIAGRAVWFYLGKLILPLDLAFSYPRWNIDASNPLLYLWPALLVAAAAALWHWRDRIGRAPIAAFTFFVATLSPMLGLVLLGTFAYSFAADHYQYVASIGPIALAAAAGYGVARRYDKLGRTIGIALTLLLLVTLGTLTWRQSRVYENRETLWRDTVDKNPDSWLAHNNLGAALRRQGLQEEALAHFQRALEQERGLKGSGGRIHYNIALALGALGRTDEAIEQYRQTLEISPGHYIAHNNLANALLTQGDVEQALAHYRRTLAIEPDYPDGLFNLGHLLGTLGDAAEASRLYREALEIDPGHAFAHRSLAQLLASQGNSDEAIRHYRAALEANPEDAEVHYNLGNVLRGDGDLDGAIEHYSRAIELGSEDALVYNNLGNALLAVGRAEQAVDSYRRSLELAPEHADGHHNLANALATLGDPGEAHRHYREALRLSPDNVAVRGDMAELLARHGQLDEALVEYREVLRLEPNNLAALNHSAWILATHPDVAARDPKAAVELARRAVEVTGKEDPLALYTLSAAYATEGRLPKAIEASRAALALAQANDATALEQQIRGQLSSYGVADPR